MKNIIFFLSGLLILCTSCDKKNDAPVKTKNDILTSGKWLLLTSKAVIQVPGSPQDNDLYASLQSCEKDNLYIFSPSGVNTIDEGLSKCDSSDPQSASTGNWQLLDNDKKLKAKIKFGIIDAEIVSEILELNDNTMTLKFDTTYLTYPTTVTSSFTHVKQ